MIGTTNDIGGVRSQEIKLVFKLGKGQGRVEKHRGRARRLTGTLTEGTLPAIRKTSICVGL